MSGHVHKDPFEAQHAAQMTAHIKELASDCCSGTFKLPEDIAAYIGTGLARAFSETFVALHMKVAKETREKWKPYARHLVSCRHAFAAVHPNDDCRCGLKEMMPDGD